MATLKVLRHCSIRSQEIWVDGQLRFTGPPAGFEAFAKAAYQAAAVDYPRFHKMDSLCKLGFLAAEHLLADGALAATPADQVGVVLANRHSSLDTDRRYHALVQQEIASPALFVYTLPNIAIGEICIRHGLKGENLLLVEDNYQPQNQVGYITNLFEAGSVALCLGGWLDYYDQQYHAFFYLAGCHGSAELPAYTADTIGTLFNT